MRQKIKQMKKRKRNKFNIIFFVIAISVIVFFGYKLYKRYSFTKERANLEEYIGVKGDEVAIFLNDTLQNHFDTSIKHKAIKRNDTVYLPLSYVKSFLNNRFYYAKDINKILYCVPDEVRVAGDTDIHQIGNAPFVIFLDEPYLLIDYVKDYTNMRYDMYLDDESKRVYIYNDWDREEIAYLKGRESARVQGGNKSPVVTDLRRGEEVKIIDTMTKWIKVKTADGYIGYIRKSKISKITERVPVSDYIEMVRKGNKLDKKPCIGFHQVLSIYSSSKLPELLKNTQGMNVIAPTWYAIRNDEGEIRSIANDAYALYCHAKKLAVWATVNNFDIADVNEKTLFSSTLTRRKMIDKILREVSVNNLDGINLDIEHISADAGEDYTEFVRELSIELTKVGCTLSIDTYVPYGFNKHYDLKEYNDFCDYVIIMCYDEHYAGSKEAGSVSSLSYVKDGIELSLTSVDKDKLIIGLPYYTRIWTTTTAGKVTSIVGSSQSIESAALNQGLKFTFDSVTSQNYGYKLTQDGDTVECWMEDDLSLAYKMLEIKKADVAGTAAWKLTQERENFFKVINMN